MKVGGQTKPKLQILKNINKYSHRTQESSPIEHNDFQSKMPASIELTRPHLSKVPDRNGLGSTSRPVKSLRNSKEKVSEGKNLKMPLFGINFLKNSLAQHLDKQEILDYASGRRRKNAPATQRITTEKNYRFTEGSQKQQHYITDKDKSVGKSKVKFRLGTKPRSLQKTEEAPLDNVDHNFKKEFSPENHKKKQSSPGRDTVATKKIVSFPRNDRINLQRDEEESHHSLSKQQKKLSQFQRQELSHYEVFYIGNRRIYSQSDFTDSEGDPKIVIHDSIAYRYEIIGQLGRGSFGKVFKAYDHKKKEHIALKIIKSQKKFQQQAKVQIGILQTALLKDPKLKCNVVRMKGSFVFRSHSCITFQILHKNLYEFLKEHQFAGFSQDLIRRFAIQILQALCFFKKNNIIHCDLKPQNILLKQQNKSGIRVIDVGSGCFEDRQIYTYIQSRFYRAPQIILGIRYTPAIDMWSFGCILVQLFTGFPIFPGESQNQQVMLFMEVLGEPPQEMLEVAERRKKFFDDNFKCKIPQEKGKEKMIGSVAIQEIVGSTDKSFLHLIKRCLEWNPLKRISPQDALMHQWILKGLPEQIRQQHIDQVQQQYY